MTSGERSMLVEVIEAIGGLQTSVGALDERMNTMEATVEKIRKSSKGANNWGKLATAAATLAPVVAGVAKAAGLI